MKNYVYALRKHMKLTQEELAKKSVSLVKRLFRLNRENILLLCLLH